MTQPTNPTENSLINIPVTFRDDWPAVWMALSVALCLFLAVSMLLFFKDVVILLAVVMAVCYALYQPHHWLKNRLIVWLPPGWPIRFIALVLTLALVAGSLALLVKALWPVLTTDGQHLLTDIPILFKRYGLSIGIIHGDAWTEVVKTLGEWLAHSILHGLHGVAGAILVIYLMLDGTKIKKTIIQAVPTRIGTLLTDSHNLLKAYVAELLLVSLFAGAVMTGVYSLLGFKYALLLGVFNGLCHGLPVAGPWLGLLPGLVLCLLSPQPEQFGWLLLWAGGLYMIKEYLLLPYLIGNTLEIHPVFVMVAFLASMELLGLWGALFMALPLASLLCALGMRIQHPHDLIK